MPKVRERFRRGTELAQSCSFGADPERAVVIDQQAADAVVAERARQVGIGAESRDLAARGVQPIQAVFGTDPEPAAPVERERKDVVVAERPRIGRVVRVVGNHAGLDIEPTQPGFARPDPDHSRAIDEDRLDVIAGERLWVVGIVAIARESVCRRVPARQTAAVGGDPEAAVGGQREIAYEVAGQGIGITALVLVVPERKSVVAIESAFRREPHEAGLILGHRHDRAL